MPISQTLGGLAVLCFQNKELYITIHDSKFNFDLESNSTVEFRKLEATTSRQLLTGRRLTVLIYWFISKRSIL